MRAALELLWVFLVQFFSNPPVYMSLLGFLAATVVLVAREVWRSRLDSEHERW